MKFENNNSKNIIFDKIFLNDHFSITIAYKDLKFCLLSLHMHSKGTETLFPPLVYQKCQQKT